MIRPFRQELKFVIHHSVKTNLIQRWSRYLTKAPFTNRYAVSPVLSQYYDSPTLQFYQEKLDGIPVRNKIRLRTYGYTYRAGATAFLEIKQRVNQSIRKIRQRIPGFHEGHLDPATWAFDDRAHRDAFQVLMERYRLKRSAQVFYLREAYQGLVESDVRITFDTSLLGLYPGERFTPELMRDRSRCLMPDTLVILEAKSTRGFPGWVQEGVLAAELQQKTVPKYITAVEVLGLPELTASGDYAR